MGRLKRFIDGADINRFRRWTQLVAFVVLVYGGWALVNLSKWLPTLSCGYNSPGRGGMCFLMPFQSYLARPWPDLAGAAGLTLLAGLAIWLAWFVFLNKAWCGFVCPIGTLQDWITALRRRLGIRYSAYGEGPYRALSKVKWVLLALAVLIPLGIGGSLFGLPRLPADMGKPFCMVCPGRYLLPLFNLDPSKLALDMSTATMTVMSGLGLLTTGLFLVGAFVKKRFMCFYCPMAALQFLFSRLALLRLEKLGDKCTRCGDCYRVCDLQIKEIADDVKTQRIMTDDCTLCLKCVAACPEEGCLQVKFAGLTILEATEHGFVKRRRGELGS